MKRRRVLAGLAAGGVSLLAGCSGGNGNGGSGNNTTHSSSGGGDGGNEGDGGARTPLAPTAMTTAAATTIATTAQQTAMQMATTPSLTATVEPTTASPTPAPMTTGSSPSTAASTGTGTTGTSTTTGSIDIDLSNLETYTGGSFTIKRPAGWSVTTSTPDETTFQSSSGIGTVTVSTTTVPSSVTTVQLVSRFLKEYRQKSKEADVSLKILNKQTVTLSNGNAAKMVSLQLDAGPVTVRQEVLFTLVNGTAYVVAVTVPESAYTSSTAKQIEKILLSLTITGNSSS